MSTIVEIPLVSLPQKLKISLNGVVYQLTVLWRGAALGWVLDIADAGGNPILSGLPMVTGVDLLEQYAHLGIGGPLWVQTDDGETPGINDLGSTAHLYFSAEAPL